MVPQHGLATAHEAGHQCSAKHYRLRTYMALMIVGLNPGISKGHTGPTGRQCMMSVTQGICCSAGLASCGNDNVSLPPARLQQCWHAAVATSTCHIPWLHMN
jgi:hypothetical protein